MASYIVRWNYGAGSYGPWIEGDIVELDAESADHINRDSPGVLALTSQSDVELGADYVCPYCGRTGFSDGQEFADHIENDPERNKIEVMGTDTWSFLATRKLGHEE